MAEPAVYISPELGAALAKVAVFALVQALVYLILRKSSGIFSPDRTARSLSFRPMRSMSVRRFVAALYDDPVGVPEDGGSSASAPQPVHRGPDPAENSSKLEKIVLPHVVAERHYCVELSRAHLACVAARALILRRHGADADADAIAIAIAAVGSNVAA
ncbi:hypothetical protein E2562_018087 [Oryza meyeriana var. granulata]|uniref:Uncharacterized protein n=1 Tax=Oryza meyeriana var. granulata TaxID=110450 RepID=A0A6G1CSN2_9ORYZ|nr:hypothetical protein E2562_018087 [Oryza meyeriana var. granulata]